MRDLKILTMLVPKELDIKTLLKYLGLWALMLLGGRIAQYREFKQFGCIRARGGITLYGIEAKFTIYVVTACAAIMFIYTFCLMVIAFYREHQAGEHSFEVNFTFLWSVCWIIAAIVSYLRYPHIFVFLFVLWPFLLIAFLMPIGYFQNKHARSYGKKL